MSRQRRALVIAHEPMGTSALLGERLRQRGFDVHTHIVTADINRPDSAAAFPDASAYDLLVVMGSIRSLTDTDDIPSWIFAETDLVLEAHERGTPTLGVCFGGQLLAAALGGAVERAPEPEIGWYSIETTAEASSAIGPGPWFQWHHDRFTPPEDAEILAVNDNAVQLFRLGSSVGTQFHPEVTYEHVQGFLSEAEPDYLARHGVSAQRLLAETAQRQGRNRLQCYTLADWFIDSAADEA